MTKSENKRTLFERIKSTIITVLVIIIILLSKCSGDGGDVNLEVNEPTVVTETITLTDTVTVVKEKFIPKWRTKVVIDTVEVQKVFEVDTLEILKDYFEKYVYIDTIQIDTLGYITILDTLSQNRVLYRKPMINIQIPTNTITLVEKKNEREYYAGLGVRTTMDRYTWMGLEGAIRSKKGNMFLIGLGTDNENNFSMGGSVHWKIFDK
jgi:hypothetical protein